MFSLVSDRMIPSVRSLLDDYRCNFNMLVKRGEVSPGAKCLTDYLMG